jgi:hypothetical protein
MSNSKTAAPGAGTSCTSTANATGSAATSRTSRQSTPRQVLENTESTQRQYALRDRAVALGWQFRARRDTSSPITKPALPRASSPTSF